LNYGIQKNQLLPELCRKEMVLAQFPISRLYVQVTVNRLDTERASHSHVGEVYPSGFLPLPAGNIRREPLAEIYQRSALFLSLRDPRNLKGKCGACEFNDVCGGSRARAYAVSGDVFAEEPCCAYLPSLYGRAAAPPQAD